MLAGTPADRFASVADRVRACIVGAGPSGLTAAIELRRAGITDLVVLERAGRVGGAWEANTYPGCACDVRSRLYELRAAPWPEWSRAYAGQAEIAAYLRKVVEVFGLDSHLRLNTELLNATWDDAQGLWHITTSQGELDADVLISACGGLTEPFTPTVRGEFGGMQMHTARWRHDVDLSGKRVAVVGTGASAIQVIPALASEVEHLAVLQRTPPWVMPRNDRPVSARRRRALAAVPPLRQAARAWTSWANEAQLPSFWRPGPFRALGERMARRHLESQVSDPRMRARLTPTYDLGCKRILLSDDYYPALQRDNVIVASALDHLTADGVVDADGVEHGVDVVIWATGFKVLDPPLADRVVGRAGRTLAEEFAQTGMAAYKGTTVAGFPNLYILQGPNTGLGHSSVLLMTEAQVDYLLPAVSSGHVLEVREEAQREYVDSIDARLAGTVWQQGGCRSWYQNGHGRNVALWPGSTHGFQRMMRRFDPSAYRIRAKEKAHVTT